MNVLSVGAHLIVTIHALPHVLETMSPRALFLVDNLHGSQHHVLQVNSSVVRLLDFEFLEVVEPSIDESEVVLVQVPLFIRHFMF